MCPDCGEPWAIGGWPFPCAGRGHSPGAFWSGDAQIHISQKVVVYERQGQIRIPGRGDRPLHPKLIAEGWERKTLNTMADIRRVERQTNTIHEQSNYNKNSAKADKDTGSA